MEPRYPAIICLITCLAGPILGATMPIDADAPAADPATALERAYALDAGKTVKRDAAGAARLYADAAAAGDAVAQLRLGYLYETGDGVPQDYAAARLHYRAAADAGLPEGHLHVAICDLEGWGGPADREAFTREMRTAAEAGNISAERIMASLYLTGIGVPRDEAMAVQWLDRAAKQGDAEAELTIGQTAESHQIRQLMHDETLARSWYQLSAENEYTEGMRAMARTFLTGPKRDRNWPLGQRWLELAIEGGDAEAPYIAAMYEMIGVDAPARIEAHAIENLQLASHRGNDKATEILDLYAGGRCLDAAFRYVLRVPYEDRYVEIQKRRHPLTDPSHPPVVYKVVQPVYPYSLRLTGVEGKVIVDFVVNTSGRVQGAYALQSTHPLFAERAVRAIEQWRFYPAQRFGQIVYAHMQTPVRFSIKSQEPIGVDASLRYARDLANQLGGDVATDATDLTIAHPRSRVPTPVDADSQPVKSARAILLLVVDPFGHPVRGHVLESTPTEIGQQVLNLALRGEYMPYTVANQPEESHQVLYFSTAPSDVTDVALNR